eukprot:2979447-Pyramimonas_sp.AAC.1
MHAVRERFEAQGASFPLLVAWLQQHRGMQERDVRRLMYDRGQEAWLALYLADPKSRMDYARTWKHAYVTDYVLHVWCCAGCLPSQKRFLCRSKLERFLHTGNLLPKDRYQFRVPCDRPGFLEKTRSTVRYYLRHVCGDNMLLFGYLMHKTCVVGTKVPSYADTFTHQPMAA